MVIMKTLLFTLEYPPFKGGVSKVYENLAKNWPKPEEFFVLDNNDGRLINEKAWPAWKPALFALYREIKARHIKTVLVGQVLPLGTAAYVLSFFLNFKYAVFLHGTDFSFSQKTARKRFLTKLILNRASKIICLNSYTAKAVEAFRGKNNLEVINPGIGLFQLPNARIIEKIQAENSLKEKFTIFSLSRLVERKGQDKMIKVIKKIVEERPDIWYYIAGSGPEEEKLKKMAAACPNIVFLGKVSEEEKWAWLSRCDLFALVGREIDGDYEGFGVVYLEAGLMGRPVLAGRSGGVEDAVKADDTGILVDPESEDEIADAIRDYYHNWHMRYDLGLGGTERVIKHFDARKQTEKVYKALAG